MRVQLHLGWPGALGAVLLAVAAATAFGLRPSLLAEQREALREYVNALDSTPAAMARDPRDAVRDAWPPESQRESDMARLAALGQDEVRHFKLDAPRVSIEPPELVRVRVGMQFDAPYSVLRRQLADTLNTMPNVTLDALQLERGQGGREPVLRCSLRWSLYFRRGS